MDGIGVLLAQRIAERDAAKMALQRAGDAEIEALRRREAAAVAQVEATTRRDLAQTEARTQQAMTADVCMMQEQELAAAESAVAGRARTLAEADRELLAATNNVAQARSALAQAHEAVEATRRHGEEDAARARLDRERRAEDEADDLRRDRHSR